MTTEEKLQHFLDTCMEDARVRSGRMLDEYKAALEKTFQEHQADAHRRSKMQLQYATEQMEREINKKLSIEQIEIRRTLGDKQTELKDKLFAEVSDLLTNFMKTPEYHKLLDDQITHAEEFANGEPMTVYLDPADADQLNSLATHHTKAQIQVSEYSFAGGTRAVIPSRHILIDNSFQTKLAEAKEAFHFDISMVEGGKDNG